jgi:hypothetical protein
MATLPALRAQEAATLAPTTPEQEQAARALVPTGGTCLEPPPMIRWQDYNGPFSKLVGTLGAKIDRPSVYIPNYKPGDVMSALAAKDKFFLFVQDTVNPFTLLNVAFNSGLDQDDDGEKRFGQGMEGFARREGANEASDATGRFFSEFLFPTVLSEDARYYRLGRGGGGRRLLHAFNMPSWLTAMTAVLCRISRNGPAPPPVCCSAMSIIPAPPMVPAPSPSRWAGTFCRIPDSTFCASSGRKSRANFTFHSAMSRQTSRVRSNETGSKIAPLGAESIDPENAIAIPCARPRSWLAWIPGLEQTLRRQQESKLDRRTPCIALH